MKALVAAGVIAASLLAGVSFGAEQEASAGASNNTMTIDLDTATPGIQSTREVGASDTVEIAVVATNVGAGGAYAGYTWEIQYPDAGLDFVSNTENSAGHGGDLCAPAATIDNPNDATADWTGQGAGCLRSSGTTTFEGDLVTIMMQCTAEGTHDIHLVTITEDDIFGSSFLDPGGALKPTLYGPDAALTCGSASPPTNTPTATGTPEPTNTPIPGVTNTATPCQVACNLPPAFTRTNTPTSTTTPGGETPAAGSPTAPPAGGSPAPTQPGGGPGGLITGPDTGQGPGGDGGAALAAALLASGSGLALLAAGGWTLRRRAARARR